MANRNRNRAAPAPVVETPVSEQETPAAPVIVAELPAIEPEPATEPDKPKTHDPLNALRVHGREPLFLSPKTVIGPNAEAKAAAVQDIRQRLSQVHDLLQQSSSLDTEGKAVASDAAGALFRQLSSGGMSRDEVTAVLGDQFGYDIVKSTGKPGKTPSGYGSAIRKRVVRLHNAYLHRYGGDGGQFFVGIREESPNKENTATFGSVMDALEAGNLSPFRVYDVLGEIKAAATVRVPDAFNPQKIADIAAELSTDEALGLLQASDGLRRAYGLLIEAFNGLAAAHEASLETPATDGETE